jgi:hypothetical protein
VGTPQQIKYRIMERMCGNPTIRIKYRIMARMCGNPTIRRKNKYQRVYPQRLYFELMGIVIERLNNVN